MCTFSKVVNIWWKAFGIIKEYIILLSDQILKCTLYPTCLTWHGIGIDMGLPQLFIPSQLWSVISIFFFFFWNCYQYLFILSCSSIFLFLLLCLVNLMMAKINYWFCANICTMVPNVQIFVSFCFDCYFFYNFLILNWVIKGLKLVLREINDKK